MTPYQVIFEEPARHDLTQCYMWGCEQWGAVQAQKWYDETIASLATLAEFPERHPIAPETQDEFQGEIRHMILGRYRALFFIGGDTVHVLHFRGGYKGKQAGN